MSRPGAAAAAAAAGAGLLPAAAAIALALLLAAAPAGAQVPHLDPFPWYAPTDSLSRLALIVNADRFVDQPAGWSANRVMLTATLPAGGRAAWFLRLPYLSMDTGGTGVPVRWPATIGDEQPADWPFGDRLEGFGQIEVGMTGGMRMPALGSMLYGFGLGLPTGQNSLYPWSSTSLPLRLQLRRDLLQGAWRHLWLGGGWLMHMDASGDELGTEAFPGGWQLEAEFAARRVSGGGWSLGVLWQNREGRASLQAAAELRFAWTAGARWGLRAVHELADPEDRTFQWLFGLLWRFDSASGLPGAGAPTP